MKSSPVSPDPGERRPSPPLVADGGVSPAVEPASDWFAALDDLMSVVEALCPTWPPRAGFSSMTDLRL
jgi:hypothetical protein